MFAHGQATQAIGAAVAAITTLTTNSAYLKRLAREEKNDLHINFWQTAIVSFSKTTAEQSVNECLFVAQRIFRKHKSTNWEAKKNSPKQ